MLEGLFISTLLTMLNVDHLYFLNPSINGIRIGLTRWRWCATNTFTIFTCAYLRIMYVCNILLWLVCEVIMPCTWNNLNTIPIPWLVRFGIRHQVLDTRLVLVACNSYIMAVHDFFFPSSFLCGLRFSWILTMNANAQQVKYGSTQNRLACWSITITNTIARSIIIKFSLEFG